MLSMKSRRVSRLFFYTYFLQSRIRHSPIMLCVGYIEVHVYLVCVVRVHVKMRVSLLNRETNLAH